MRRPPFREMAVNHTCRKANRGRLLMPGLADAAGTSNFSDKFSPSHQMKIPLVDGKLKLRILLDSSPLPSQAGSWHERPLRDDWPDRGLFGRQNTGPEASVVPCR